MLVRMVMTSQRAILYGKATAHVNTFNLCPPAPHACGRGKHERAAECFRAALALRSGEARTLFKLGNACFALQRFAAAEDAFEQALRVRASLQSHADTCPELRCGRDARMQARLEAAISTHKWPLTACRASCNANDSDTSPDPANAVRKCDVQV